MSTAGKVLVVLVMLASIAWTVLTAGVAQINRNANRALQELQQQIDKLRDDLRTTQRQIVQLKDETVVVQERMDADLAVTFARQVDVERVNSSVREILSRVEYQLSKLQEEIDAAERAKAAREEEKAAEQKALAESLAEVERLNTETNEMMNRLFGLRNEFKTTLKANIDLLGQTVR